MTCHSVYWGKSRCMYFLKVFIGLQIFNYSDPSVFLLKNSVSIYILLPSVMSFYYLQSSCLFFLFTIDAIIDIYFISSQSTTQWLDFYICWHHHSKFNYHLSLFKVIAVWLTIFPILYITFPWLIYFITRSLCL